MQNETVAFLIWIFARHRRECKNTKPSQVLYIYTKCCTFGTHAGLPAIINNLVCSAAPFVCTAMPLYRIYNFSPQTHVAAGIRDSFINERLRASAWLAPGRTTSMCHRINRAPNFAPESRVVLVDGLLVLYCGGVYWPHTHTDTQLAHAWMSMVE